MSNEKIEAIHVFGHQDGLYTDRFPLLAAFAPPLLGDAALKDVIDVRIHLKFRNGSALYRVVCYDNGALVAQRIEGEMRGVG